MVEKLELPLDKKKIKRLKIGDKVYLSGVLYTARDAPCNILKRLLNDNKRLPIPLKDQVIYFAGPTPPVKGRVIGSCGPTTASRMSEFIPIFFKKGLSAIIGKGELPVETRDYIKRYGGIYLLAIGGAGAYVSKFIKAARVVAFRKLGPEAIYRLEVRDFPAIVGIDSRGEDIYEK